MNLENGDCFKILKSYSPNFFDALVTDPPAGISFMNKSWDSDKGGRDGWIAWMTGVMTECHRVMKPGAHGLVWAIPRTSHWTAMSLENAGFQIRDVITHLFGSGFPKSHNVEKATKNSEWAGWGTALKPASEHWILIRKPCSEKTVAQNVEKWGVGGINIDASRIDGKPDSPGSTPNTANGNQKTHGAMLRIPYKAPFGRFPANLILSHTLECKDDICSMFCPVRLLDDQSLAGGMHGAGVARKGSRNPRPVNAKCNAFQEISNTKNTGLMYRFGDSGGASRFFYCAKASKKDRNEGLDGAELVWENDAWLKLDLSLLMESISQLPKDTFDVLLMESLEWNIDGSGNSITEKFRKDFKFTIETVSKLITELKTLNVLAPLNTKESIQGAIKMIEANGLSLVATAEFIRKSPQTITNERTVIVMNASAVLFEELAQTRLRAKTGNFHSTVKSSKLMEYLCTLITPPKGKVLDPFMGSGSTGIAAQKLGFEFFGIEQNKEYFDIACNRLQHNQQ